MKTLIACLSLVVLAGALPQFPHGFGDNLDDIPVASVRSKFNSNYVPNEYEVMQNRAARYEFMTDIDDKISDQTQTRTETRNGLDVKGSYSYSDGFVKRTVHYVADQNGYRVLRMDAEPLSTGPKVDLNGIASVSNAAHGTHVAYRVQSIPVEGPVGKIVDGQVSRVVDDPNN